MTPARGGKVRNLEVGLIHTWACFIAERVFHGQLAVVAGEGEEESVCLFAGSHLIAFWLGCVACVHRT